MLTSTSSLWRKRPAQCSAHSWHQSSLPCSGIRPNKLPMWRDSTSNCRALWSKRKSRRRSQSRAGVTLSFLTKSPNGNIPSYLWLLQLNSPNMYVFYCINTIYKPNCPPALALRTSPLLQGHVAPGAWWEEKYLYNYCLFFLNNIRLR